MNDHIEIEAGPLDVFSQPASAVRLIDSALQPLGRTKVLAANVQVSFMTADSIRGDDESFQQSVRVALQNISVLESAGLALVCVHHQIPRLGGLLRNEGPLLPGRKPRPAQPAKPRLRYFLDYLSRRHRAERLAGREVSAVMLVVFE